MRATLLSVDDLEAVLGGAGGGQAQISEADVSYVQAGLAAREAAKSNRGDTSSLAEAEKKAGEKSGLAQYAAAVARAAGLKDPILTLRVV